MPSDTEQLRLVMIAPGDNRSATQYEECMMARREVPFLLNLDRAKAGALVKRHQLDKQVASGWFILITPTYNISDERTAARRAFKWIAFDAETGQRCKISLRDRLYEVQP